MTQKQSRIVLVLAVAVVSTALLLLLVGLLVSSSDQVAIGVPVILGAGLMVSALLLLGWRAISTR